MLQLARHGLGMERVMGIEPIGDSRPINMLVVSGEASAIQVRDFATRGALSGNLWQLTGMPSKVTAPRADREPFLLQAHGTVELGKIPIERAQWQVSDLSRALQHEAV